VDEHARVQLMCGHPPCVAMAGWGGLGHALSSQWLGESHSQIHEKMLGFSSHV